MAGNMVGNAPDIEDGAGQEMAYALYVLARAGRAPVGDLKYLADTKINQFGSPLARAQVAAALSILGDQERADAAFASADIRGLRRSSPEEDALAASWECTWEGSLEGTWECTWEGTWEGTAWSSVTR